MLGNSKKKIIVVSGKTASFKSSLGIALAKKLNGEIISADSRQIFKGLEEFSGAVTDTEQDGIKHHLISFVNPGTFYSAFDFKESTERIVDEIISRNKIPIIVGGTTFYLKTILFEKFLADVEPDFEFRKKMEEKNTDELFQLLKSKDSDRAIKIDSENKNRIIRSLEVIDKMGHFPVLDIKENSKYKIFLIGIFANKETVDKNIGKNFNKRVNGMLKEAENLKGNLSKDQFFGLGLAYKNIFNLWEDKISREEFISLGIKEEQKYAKRQGTALKKLFKQFPGRSAIYNLNMKFLKQRVLFRCYLFLLK